MTLYPSGRKLYSKIRIAPGAAGRATYQLHAGLDEAAATVRDALLTELAGLMRAAGLDAERVIDPLLHDLAADDAGAAARREAYIRTRVLPGKKGPAAVVPTVQAFGELWTSGKLAEQFPEQVRPSKGSADRGDLRRHVYPVIGDVLVSAVRLEHVEQVLRALPTTMAKSTKGKILAYVHRLLAIAVYPARLLDHNPMPKGLKPRRERHAFAYVYPKEEAQLLACRQVPLYRRLANGLSARTGMRLSEILSLTWGQVDLEHGYLRLTAHKTLDEVGARLVPLDAATVRVLAWYKGGERDESDLVIDAGRTTLENRLRDDLTRAGVTRTELHTGSRGQKRANFHSWRRGFVTLSLGDGRTEDWVMRRTGHTNSVMLGRYRQAAATAAELKLGWLLPFDEALPEIADSLRGQSGPLSAKNTEGTEDPSSVQGTIPLVPHDRTQRPARTHPAPRLRQRYLHPRHAPAAPHARPARRHR